MEVFGKVKNCGRHSNIGEVGLYVHKDKDVNLVIRKKELLKLNRIMFGFDNNRMYLLDKENDPDALKVSRRTDADTACVRSANPEIYERVKDFTGEYEVEWDKSLKEWYIILKKSKEVK